MFGWLSLAVPDSPFLAVRPSVASLIPPLISSSCQSNYNTTPNVKNTNGEEGKQAGGTQNAGVNTIAEQVALHYGGDEGMCQPTTDCLL
jgi:hypothetical protein